MSIIIVDMEGTQTQSEQPITSPSTALAVLKPVVRRTKAGRKAWIKVFLPLVAQHATVSAAWQAMPIDPKTCRRMITLQNIYTAIKRHPALARAVAKAIELSDEAVYSEIYRRGIKGFPKAIVYQGQVTGTTTEYSDALAAQIAKARLPGFKDAPQSVTIHSTGPTYIGAMTPAKFAELSPEDKIKLLTEN